MASDSVIVSVVQAIGGFAGKLLERGGGQKKMDPATEKRATEVISKAYDELRPRITDGCCRVLLYLEDGENRPPFQIQEAVLAKRPPSSAWEAALSGEFKYRLEYLKQTGVLMAVGGSEYAITHLGASFLQQARARRDYKEVLFRKA